MPAAVRIRSARRLPATLALTLVAAVAIAATHAPADGAPSLAPVRPDLSSAVLAAATPVAPVEAEPTPTSVPFAMVEGAELVLPADDVVTHGFHEPGGGGPLALTPVGTMLPGEGGNGFDEADAVADASGPEYLVLPTRHRGTAPTGAVDVVLAADQAVVAPVDGTIVKVADYALYGRHADTLLHIRPAAAPHLEVKVLHVDGPTVAEGDTVVAGETVIAAEARRMPVRNQIDRYAGDALPHVHLEVVPADA